MDSPVVTLGTARRRRLLLTGTVAAALLCLGVSPPTPAQAASGKPEATASGKVKKQLRKLKRKVKRLQRQLDELSAQVGPQGPAGPQGEQGPDGPAGPSTGAAGGDLTGSYPDPEIAGGAVNSAKVANNSLLQADLGAGSVAGSEVANNSLFQDDLGFNAVGASELASSSVSTDELASVTERPGTPVATSGGNYATASASCNLGELPLMWDARWTALNSNTQIVNVDMNGAVGGGVTVLGYSGTNASLTVTVLCLSA